MGQQVNGAILGWRPSEIEKKIAAWKKNKELKHIQKKQQPLSKQTTIHFKPPNQQQPPGQPNFSLNFSNGSDLATLSHSRPVPTQDDRTLAKVRRYKEDQVSNQEQAQQEKKAEEFFQLQAEAAEQSSSQAAHSDGFTDSEAHTDIEEAEVAVADISNMGPQSQMRRGAIRKSKSKKPHQELAVKRGKAKITFSKNRGGQQKLNADGRAFDPMTDCKLCQMKEAHKKDPTKKVRKIGHHPECPSRTVKPNRLSSPKQPTQKDQVDASPLGKKISVEFDKSPPTKVYEGPSNGPRVVNHRSPSVETLRKQMAEHVASKVEDPTFLSKVAAKTKAPKAIAAVFDFLVEEILPKKAGIDKQNQFAQTSLAQERKRRMGMMFLPNSFCIEIPPYRPACKAPNPHYHSIEGQKVYVVAWEFVCQGIMLRCPMEGTSGQTCNGRLDRFRTNWSLDKSLFPVFSMSGPPSWCAVQRYGCQKCSSYVDSNDARLLASLPQHLSQCYPVNPKWAAKFKDKSLELSGKPTYHIDRATTNMYEEEAFLTYGNGELMSRNLYNAIVYKYTEKVGAYADLVKYLKTSNNISINFVPPRYLSLHNDFVTHYPPDGKALRELFLAASTNPLNPYNYSDMERYR